MNTPPDDIRRAAPADLPAVARLHLQSSRIAYRGICPDEVLDALTLAGRLELWRRRFDSLGPDGRLWISERAGIVGFVAADRAAGEGKNCCELQSLYVAPDWWGRRVGHDLMRWLLDDLRDRGFDRVFLWTIAENSRARDFYEKAGFGCDRRMRKFSRRESGVTIEYDEIRYSRDLQV